MENTGNAIGLIIIVLAGAFGMGRYIYGMTENSTSAFWGSGVITVTAVVFLSMLFLIEKSKRKKSHTVGKIISFNAVSFVLAVLYLSSFEFVMVQFSETNPFGALAHCILLAVIVLIFAMSALYETRRAKK